MCYELMVTEMSSTVCEECRYIPHALWTTFPWPSIPHPDGLPWQSGLLWNSTSFRYQW